jgi:hypothetical protein
VPASKLPQIRQTQLAEEGIKVLSPGSTLAGVAGAAGRAVGIIGGYLFGDYLGDYGERLQNGPSIGDAYLESAKKFGPLLDTATAPYAKLPDSPPSNYTPEAIPPREIAPIADTPSAAPISLGPGRQRPVIEYEGTPLQEFNDAPLVRRPIKASPTVPELVAGAIELPAEAADYIKMDHVIDGEIKSFTDDAGNVIKFGVGGHYLKSPDVRVSEIVSPPDVNGVQVVKVQIRDPATGAWVDKAADTSAFPTSWSESQARSETLGAFANSGPLRSNRNPNDFMWRGISPGGVPFEGYYSKRTNDGTAVTGWPVYTPPRQPGR